MNELIEKYYTPNIDEFYIGFEYEYLIDSVWYNVAFHPSDMVEYIRFQSDLYDKGIIRVKYLDLNDIESIGFLRSDYTIDNFRFIQCYCNDLTINNFICCNIDKYRNIFIDNSNNSCFNIIITTVAENKNTPCFIGDIKNKSELIKILNSLGII